MLEARLYMWDKKTDRLGELVAVAPCKKLLAGEGLIQFKIKDLAILPGEWHLVVEDTEEADERARQARYLTFLVS